MGYFNAPKRDGLQKPEVIKLATKLSCYSHPVSHFKQSGVSIPKKDSRIHIFHHIFEAFSQVDLDLGSFF